MSAKAPLSRHTHSSLSFSQPSRIDRCNIKHLPLFSRPTGVPCFQSIGQTIAGGGVITASSLAPAALQRSNLPLDPAGAPSNSLRCTSTDSYLISVRELAIFTTNTVRASL